MTEQGTRDLWLVGMPSDELEQDLESWKTAERVLNGLVDTFHPVRGHDAVFVTLVDARIRAKKHAEYLQEKARSPEPEEPGEAPTVLTAVNRLLSEAADLLGESHPPTEEEYEAERKILERISEAGLILTAEQRRQHEGGEDRSTPDETGREHWTPEKREHWDARADHEAWGLAHSVLESWVRAAEPIGSPELTRVMKKALEEVEDEVGKNLDRLQAAEAALEKKPGA